MQIKTIILYLIGDRQAILSIAANRNALWVGLIFVFSAAFAREYDGQYLVAEPWHLVIPVVASLVASFLLFLVVCGPLFLRREGRPPFFRAYRSFLTLFWMTAPLAWLYAIPYERFMSAGNATTTNLWTLAFVAAWRVSLMVRACSVLTGRGIVSSSFLVLLFADTAALTAVYFMPKPIISVMGGVRQTDSENAIVGATMVVTCIGVLLAPICMVGALIALLSKRVVWQAPLETSEKSVLGLGVKTLTVLSLLVWLPILPWTQREQQLRAQVERDMRDGRIDEALELMSSHAQSDFPPHWDPPPRIAYGDQSHNLLDLMEILVTRQYSPWVRTLFLEKFCRSFGDEWIWELPGNAEMQNELPKVVSILERIPEGPDIAAKQRNIVSEMHDYRALPDPVKADLKRLLDLAKKKK